MSQSRTTLVLAVLGLLGVALVATGVYLLTCGECEVESDTAPVVVAEPEAELAALGGDGAEADAAPASLPAPPTPAPEPTTRSTAESQPAAESPEPTTQSTAESQPPPESPEPTAVNPPIAVSPPTAVSPSPASQPVAVSPEPSADRPPVVDILADPDADLQLNSALPILGECHAMLQELAPDTPADLEFFFELQVLADELGELSQAELQTITANDLAIDDASCFAEVLEEGRYPAPADVNDGDDYTVELRVTLQP